VIRGEKIIELPDGKLAAVGNKKRQSFADHGASWTPVLQPTPIQPSGVIYAPARQSFFILALDCWKQGATPMPCGGGLSVRMEARN